MTVMTLVFVVAAGWAATLGGRALFARPTAKRPTDGSHSPQSAAVVWGKVLADVGTRHPHRRPTAPRPGERG